MGLIDFVKDAGEKIFGRGDAQAQIEQANSAAADAILRYIRTRKLDARDLQVSFDAASATASVFGVAPDQATHEKIVLCAGNIEGVAGVNDMMTVERMAPEARFYTVRPGDTLAGIARQFYGDVDGEQRILDANRPLLDAADRIYPGEKIRIPQP